MPKYPDLDTVVGKLKQSAIDAWVKETGWLMKIEADRYVMAPIPLACAITRPNSYGQGGGTWTSADGESELPDEHWLAERVNESAFENIRSTIDKIVDPWRDLPKPAAIDEVVHSCESASMGLSVTATTEDGVVMGTGAIEGPLKSINDKCREMAGTTIEAFQDKFINRLSGVISSLWAISGIRSEAIAAQKGLWLGSRQAVIDILENARVTFDKIANHHAGTDGLRVTLDVVKWVTEGIAVVSIACPPVAIGAGLVSLSASITDELVGEPEQAQEDPGSYDDTMAFLTKKLDTLNRKITSAETYIERKVRENIDAITRNKISFDLTLVSIRPGGEDQIKILDRSLIEGIVRTHMPSVAEELEAIAKTTDSCDPYGAVARAESIGVGPHGPSSSIQELSHLLRAMLTDLAWEVRSGAENLRAAAAYFFEQEEAIANELNRIADKVEAGSDYSPLDSGSGITGGGMKRVLGDLRYILESREPTVAGEDGTG